MAQGTTGDDTGRDGVPVAARRSAWWRLGLLAVTVAAVYGTQLAVLPPARALDTPSAFADLALLIVVILAVLGIRDTPAGPAVVPLRVSDLLCGNAMLALAVIVGWAGPALFGSDTTLLRVPMASLPFFLAGAVWLLFGGRAVWWLRHSLAFSLVAAPVWYIWAASPVLAWSADLSWLVVEPLADHLGVPVVDTATGQGFLVLGDGAAVMGAAGSGASMVAWMVLGGALSTRLRGSRRSLWRWLLVGMALVWLAEVSTILALALTGRYVPAELVSGWLPPVAGLLSASAAAVVMVRSARRMGLEPVVGERAPVLGRLAAVAPPTWEGGALCVIVAAGLLLLNGTVG